MNWKEYQEEAAKFFRGLGLIAETDVRIQGIRTKHNVDVVVRSHHAGFDITWIVECKHWYSKVSKLHVLALREIVSDIGADRGILLAEKGFHIGAVEAANLTNVQVTSLENVKQSARNSIYSMKLRDLFDRLTWCKKEYWEIPKVLRIESGLRPEAGGGFGYSGNWAIQAGEDLIAKGFRGEYPIIPDEFYQISKNIIELEIPQRIESIKDLHDLVESIVKNLENKINDCKNTPKNYA